jgi:hypothetical protein
MNMLIFVVFRERYPKIYTEIKNIRRSTVKCSNNNIRSVEVFKVTEHLWVLILPKIFLVVSMKALD